MKCLFALGLVSIIFAVISRENVDARTLEELETLGDEVVDPVQQLTKSVDTLRKVVSSVLRQTMLQQLFVEERIRSDADSGVKQVRHTRAGTRNYYSSTHSSTASVLSIHDHSNNERTVGMGEFVAVLNGVEFRTRHNDYRLYMPHKTSDKWHAIENIPFPEVPKAVTDKQTPEEQITEMREWFKAWKNQDASTRDYTKYFKPVLCYLEGAWTTETTGPIDEPFESDRHFVDAKSWFDLHEKVRFTSYTGRKDNLENFSFLPTTIMNVTEEGYPQFAQWNYRILCHPISRVIPLNRFRVVDELGLRVANTRTLEEHAKTRAARFQLNPYDKDTWTDRTSGQDFTLLDEIMSEIPGKDNYQGNLEDAAFDLQALSRAPGSEGTKLKADRYHRRYKVASKGAMGESNRHRGFADENLFMAMNTQSKVAGMTQGSCKKKKQQEECTFVTQKWSYAIPLEIIYLTPLSEWNPFDIEYKGDSRSESAKSVEANGRNGGNTLAKAYNGIHSKKYYQTPVEFFSGKEVGAGLADTTKNSVSVLDKQGKLRTTKASGTRIAFPEIADVGILRQRYPIMPVHGEGSSVWKELEALKDILLKSKTNGYIFDEPLGSGTSGPSPIEPPRGLTLETSWSKSKEFSSHVHEITLTTEQVEALKAGNDKVTVITNEVAGHQHTVQVAATIRCDKIKKFYLDHCDDQDTTKTRCFDKHGKGLTLLPNL